MIHIAVASMTISIALVAVPASAQSFLSPRPGHGFATVGVIDVANDPADSAGETTVGQTVNRGNLLVTGAVFVAPHVGVGIETFPEHDTTALVSNTLSGTLSEQLQEKTALMITARGRALARSHVAVDGVFGVGALRQTRTFTFDPRDPRDSTTTRTSDHTSPAFSLGADVTIAVARHVAVIPQVRWYHLRRLGNPVNTGATPTGLDTPASLFAFGLTAGVTW
jgi:hypothetical protein